LSVEDPALSTSLLLSHEDHRNKVIATLQQQHQSIAMARTKSTARKQPSEEAQAVIDASTEGMEAPAVEAPVKPKPAKRQKTSSSMMYLVVMHESYSSGDPLEPKIVGVYSSKELALANARSVFERHSYYFEDGGFNEEAEEKLEEKEDNALTVGDSGKIYYELSHEGDELTVTMNKVASDKPCPKTLPSISIY
jgi:hypothetical protein